MVWTLNKKLIFMILALSASLLLMMTLFGFYSERLLLAKLQKKTTEITEAIHLAIQEIAGTESQDIMGLYRYLKGLKTEGIKEISIIDNQIKVKASTNPFKVGQETSKKITDLVFKSELGEFVTKEGDLHHIILPIVIKGEHQGYIHLVISNRDTLSFIKRNLELRIVVTLFILFIGFLVTLWLSRRYTRPIKELASAAGKVASGDLDIELGVTENDEVGELKRSFNQMIRGLKELRKMEQKLREAEHLSTIGELSRSVAHEIRNPLNFISLSIDHLRGHCSGETEELLKNIKQEIKRLDSLVESFLQYGRPLKIKPSRVDVTSLIEETLSLVEAKAERAGIKVVKNYPVEGLSAELDRELIKTCLFNALINAIEAMPQGGTLTVEASLNSTEQTLQLSVSDTGEGIDESLAQKVFEPFFTTKQQGLGLGLAMTRKVIDEHRGKVFFESSKGRGSKITFVLPIRL
ncbi:MAG: sensor histidine kinase [Nitrospirae bacterium]|nr:MAG: sensor histidine kinase [Nitrospirota bacterium]